MNKQRLIKLAEFLEQLPKEKFDYNQWVGRDWKGKPDLSCGTVACALGWATTIPEFAKEGLCLVPNTKASLENYISYSNSPMAGRVVLVREGRETINDSFDAGARVFGLSLEEANFLFGPAIEQDEQASAKYVAAKIRWFVDEGQDVEANEDEDGLKDAWDSHVYQYGRKFEALNNE